MSGKDARSKLPTNTPGSADTESDTLTILMSEVLGTPLYCTNLSQELDSRRMTAIARLLHYRIRTRHAGVEVDRILGTLSELSEQSTGELLRSPSLCEVLRLDLTEGGLEANVIEQLMLQSQGPRVVPDEADTPWERGFGRSGILDSPTRGLGSPRLSCGIPVDLSLPAQLERPHAGLVDPRTLSPAEMESAITTLDTATEILLKSYPTGHSVLTDLVGNICLRVDSGRSNECWGASSGIAVGRIVVVNPIIPEPAFLAEILLHESTHCALDCAELSRSLLDLNATEFPIWSTSPWSQNPLSPHALVHATVVWAVLLDYWDCYLVDHDLDEVVATRYRYIRRGFEVLDTATILPPLAPFLTSAATELVERARDLALDRPRVVV